MAKNDMLGNVVRKLVEIPTDMFGAIYDFLEKLSGDDGREWFTEFKNFLRKKPSWTGVVTKTILDFVGTVDVSATTEEFVVKDHYVVNTSEHAPVKISFLGENIKNNFLGKVEDPVGEMTLGYYNLKDRSRDIPIITELGGEDAVESTLCAVFALMRKQPKGEDGTLLNNGYANIFYVRDVNQVLWAVCVPWRGDGWSVYARSVDDSSRWYDGFRVFSRNPSKP